MTEFQKIEYTVAAKVHELVDEMEAENILAFYKSSDQAAADPVVNGKPRMLLLTAWIAHEGRNLNGQVFIKDELKRVVVEGKLFAPPHAGMVDFNHDFMARGLWYKSAYAFDEEAQKWGILANGAVWAWRFPELADKVLAEMQRNGNIPCSMSAQSDSIELSRDYPGAEGQHTVILHNPVFFTTSLLDVPPGDAFGRAVGSEKTDKEPVMAVLEDPSALVTAQKNDSKENTMDEKQIQELRDSVVAALAAKDAAEASALDYKNKFEAELAAKATVVAELASTQTKLSELELALRTTADSLKAAADAKTAYEAELNTCKAELESYKVKEKEEADNVRLEARLAQLPENMRNKLDSLANKDALLAAWKVATDEDWNTTKEILSLAAADTTYADRSILQGHLAGGTKTASETDLSKHLR